MLREVINELTVKIDFGSLFKQISLCLERDILVIVVAAVNFRCLFSANKSVSPSVLTTYVLRWNQAIPSVFRTGL